MLILPTADVVTNTQWWAAQVPMIVLGVLLSTTLLTTYLDGRMKR